jgi:hypothetical protein
MAIICWPSAVLAPTQSYSLPARMAFAATIAASANATRDRTLGHVELGRDQLVLEDQHRVGPPFAPPPLPQAFGLSCRMAHASACDRLSPPTGMLLRFQSFAWLPGLQPSGPCVFQ